MMTDERAGQHLMQLTLGDSVLIRSTDDADKILMELESQFEEKHRDRATIEVAAAEAAAAERIRQANVERERQANAAREAASNEMMARSELDALRTDAERKQAQLEARSQEQLSAFMKEKVDLERRLSEERNAHIDEKLPLMQQCVRNALGAERRRGHWISVLVGCFTFVAAYLSTNFMTSIDSRFSIVAAAVASVISAVTFWNNPDRLFGGMLHRARDERYRELVEEYQLHTYLSAFFIDWSTGAVSRVLERSLTKT
jgi:RNA binding exosome subunit